MAHEKEISCMEMCLNQNKKVLFSGSHDGFIHAWKINDELGNPQNFMKVASKQTNDSVNALALINNNNFLVAGLGSGAIFGWDLNTNTEQCIQMHDSAITCLKEHNNVLISADMKGAIMVHDTSSFSKILQG